MRHLISHPVLRPNSWDARSVTHLTELARRDLQCTNLYLYLCLNIFLFTFTYNCSGEPVRLRMNGVHRSTRSNPNSNPDMGQLTNTVHPGSPERGNATCHTTRLSTAVSELGQTRNWHPVRRVCQRGMRHLHPTDVLYFGQQTADCRLQTARMNVPDNVWKIHRYMIYDGSDAGSRHREIASIVVWQRFWLKGRRIRRPGFGWAWHCIDFDRGCTI